ncbi:unnamed protein product [Gongylonema pulchrum]|uniref:GIY-YIG domain-containing protein n=1 Tax=Gongylonema pulchrum TaxID=637853 RepID=A0A183EYU8_9BILA|nr:unnamed protein product [Gongylonema pulchrum]
MHIFRYNCGDESCYLDLARLRGVKYFTWAKNDKVIAVGENLQRAGQSHKKFQNYRFDGAEFRRLVLLQIEYVRRHPAYVAEVRKRRRKQFNEEL